MGGASRYSSSVTCSPQLTGLPDSSASCIGLASAPLYPAPRALDVGPNLFSENAGLEILGLNSATPKDLTEHKTQQPIPFGCVVLLVYGHQAGNLGPYLGPGFGGGFGRLVYP